MKNIAFLIGLCFGSFALCIAQRLAKSKTLWGSSECDHCGHPLGFLDLIPLFSFFANRGRCRYCGSRISWLYPMTELLMGCVSLLLYEKLGFSIYSFNRFFWCLLLIVIAIEDALSMEINVFVLLGTIVFGLLIRNGKSMDRFDFLFQIIVLLFIKVTMALMSRYKKKEMMGEGDLWLMLCGLGFSLRNHLLSLLLGSLAGCVYALVFKRKKDEPFPFAPFLCASYTLVNFLELFCPLE